MTGRVDWANFASNNASEAVMLDVRSLSTEELWQTADRIKKELERRQKELQQTCSHPEYVAIMYMRPGATYRGCKVCQKPAPESRS